MEATKVLATEGAYVDEAVDGNYLEKADDAARQKEWADAGLPDPCMVRAWWSLKRELPVKEPNYRQWLDKGALMFVPVAGNGEWNLHMALEMGRLENRLRDHEPAAEQQPVAEPAPAMEADPQKN